jgi:uncharacterized protein (UPF0303 family)
MNIFEHLMPVGGSGPVQLKEDYVYVALYVSGVDPCIGPDAK